MAAVFAAAVFFAGAISVPQTVYAADQTIDADNMQARSELHRSVVEGTIQPNGKSGRQFDTGAMDSDLAQLTEQRQQEILSRKTASR